MLHNLNDNLFTAQILNMVYVNFSNVGMTFIRVHKHDGG